MVTAHALAINERVPLSQRHLETVISLNKECEKDFRGVGSIANQLANL